MTHTSLHLVLHSISLVAPLLFPHLSRLPHLNILFLHYMPTFSGDQLSLVSCFGVSEDPVWCHLGLQGNHIAHQSLPKEEQKLNTLICNCIPLVLFNLLLRVCLTMKAQMSTILGVLTPCRLCGHLTT